MDLDRKFQLQPGQRLLILHLPEALSSTLAELESTESNQEEPALLVFVLNRSSLEENQAQIVASASNDRLTWVAYPKSGQLGTDLNRDIVASYLTERGVQPVRQIALDDVWSSLRFRPV